MAGAALPEGPVFDENSHPQFVRPQANRYFQYRVVMEADENRACGGQPCLPELTSVSLESSNEPRYFGQSQVVTNREPVFFTQLQSIDVQGASDCVGFQLSPDGTNFYSVKGGRWVLVNSTSGFNGPGGAEAGADTLSLSSAADIETYATEFSRQFAPGNLFFKIFLRSKDTRTPCSVGPIQLQYRDRVL